ncbi:cytochrome P450, partial [Streptomyces sp. NPDC059651]
AHYPRVATVSQGVGLRAGLLVGVTSGAANPPSRASGSAAVVRSGGSAHLAWSAGPHRCPAKQPALLIAMTAIEQLTSQLCDAELAVPVGELLWRPGPFHRALVHLPVRFAPLDTTASTGPERESAGHSAVPIAL